MSSADEAAAALRASKEINQAQQALTEESRLLLVALVRDEMRIAVAEGITAALTEEAAELFWSKGIEVLQRQARKRAGEVLVDSFTTAAKRLVWLAIFVVFAYSVGGWSLMKTVWYAITKG